MQYNNSTACCVKRGNHFMEGKFLNKIKINRQKLIVFLLFFAFSISFVYTLIVQTFDEANANRQLAELNASIEYQTQLGNELKNEISIVSTPEYIEKIARDELNYAAPDEIVFIVSSQRF